MKVKKSNIAETFHAVSMSIDTLEKIIPAFVKESNNGLSSLKETAQKVNQEKTHIVKEK